MYLLNLVYLDVIDKLAKAFTFHYVSIKSKGIVAFFKALLEFTFHYVSIKSKKLKAVDAVSATFTFHYVSIKSR